MRALGGVRGVLFCCLLVGGDALAEQTGRLEDKARLEQLPREIMAIRETLSRQSKRFYFKKAEFEKLQDQIKAWDARLAHIRQERNRLMGTYPRFSNLNTLLASNTKDRKRVEAAQNKAKRDLLSARGELQKISAAYAKGKKRLQGIRSFLDSYKDRDEFARVVAKAEAALTGQRVNGAGNGTGGKGKNRGGGGGGSSPRGLDISGLELDTNQLGARSDADPAPSKSGASVAR